MRVSAGFLVTGLSGKTLIHTLPPRLILRVIATRAASIWRLVIHPPSSALRLSVILPFASSRRMTFTVTASPSFSRSPARATRACESSDIGTNPWMPPRSTKAPKSASDTTVPGSTASTAIFLRVSSAAFAACASRIWRRDTTMLRPFSS